MVQYKKNLAVTFIAQTPLGISVSWVSDTMRSRVPQDQTQPLITYLATALRQRDTFYKRTLLTLINGVKTAYYLDYL